jgi:transposase InsO family protein
MTEELHCYENAMAEQVNGILKQEYYIGSCFRNKDQAKEAVKEAVYLYNTMRPHMSLDYETPEKMHRIAA